MHIRRAERKDASRIAEILVFGNRVNFYPIFKEDEYSFASCRSFRRRGNMKRMKRCLKGRMSMTTESCAA